MTEGGTSEPIGSPEPVRLGARIGALDVFRGVAVLAILLMNMNGFALPVDATEYQLSVGVSGWLDAWTYGVLTFAFEGTARGAFGLLFGASVVLLTTRLEAKGEPSADIHLRRNMWLIAFGLVHAYGLLWSWDILYFYGVIGLLLYVFRKLPPWALLACAGVAWLPLVGGNTAQMIQDYGLEKQAIVLHERVDQGETLTEEEQETLDTWLEWKRYDTDPEKLAEQTKRYQGGYGTIWLGQRKGIIEGHTKGLYYWGLWDGAMFMLTGMALFKLGIITGARSARFYLVMAGVCYAVAFPLRGYTLWLDVTKFEHPGIEAWGWVLYDGARMAMTLGHTAVVMLFTLFLARSVLAYMLGACGRMALTNYIAQTVICGWFFWGVGLGLYGTFSRFELLAVILTVWTAQLVWSPIWLMVFRFGPLEWAWRSLTYWQVQPILRERADHADPPPSEAPN